MEDSSNPYAPPTFSTSAPENSLDCSGLFRHSKSLVLNLDSHRLPPICFKTGQPTESVVEVEGTVTQATTTLASMMAFGAVGMLAAKYLLGTRVRFSLPLSQELKERISNEPSPWLLGAWLGGATILAGMCLVLVHDAFAYLALLGFLVFGASLAKVYIAKRGKTSPFRITSATGSYIHVAGVNADVLNALPKWNGNSSQQK